MKKAPWQSRAWSFNSEHHAILDFTEVNLATLEELATLKSSSNARVNRQCSICATMVSTIKRFNIEVPDSKYGSAVRAPRVRDLMKALPSEPNDVDIYNKIYELHVNDMRKPYVGDANGV